MFWSAVDLLHLLMQWSLILITQRLSGCIPANEAAAVIVTNVMRTFAVLSQFDTARIEMLKFGGLVQDIGALTQDEKLTKLGEKLGALHVYPTTRKMLLFFIFMNCLKPALPLACAADYRDHFILPMTLDEKKKATVAKAELASLYGGYSDQLAVVAAFEYWKRAKDGG